MVTCWCSLPTMARCRMRAVCDVLSLGQTLAGFSRYGPWWSVFGGSFQAVAALAGNGDRGPSLDKGDFFAPQDWKTMERRILMNQEG